MSVRVFDSTEALSEEAANYILQLLGPLEGPFHLVLSGGVDAQEALHDPGFSRGS